MKSISIIILSLAIFGVGGDLAFGQVPFTPTSPRAKTRFESLFESLGPEQLDHLQLL